MAKRLNWDEIVINIDGQRLNHLRFADDILLISDAIDLGYRMLEDFEICRPKNIFYHNSIDDEPCYYWWNAITTSFLLHWKYKYLKLISQCVSVRKTIRSMYLDGLHIYNSRIMNQCMLSITLRDMIPNETIRGWIRVEYVVTPIARLKRNWAGIHPGDPKYLGKAPKIWHIQESS